MMIGFPPFKTRLFVLTLISAHSRFGGRLAIGFPTNLKAPHNLTGLPNNLKVMALVKIGVMRGAGVIALNPDAMIDVARCGLALDDFEDGVIGTHARINLFHCYFFTTS